MDLPAPFIVNLDTWLLHLAVFFTAIAFYSSLAIGQLADLKVGDRREAGIAIFSFLLACAIAVYMLTCLSAGEQAHTPRFSAAIVPFVCAIVLLFRTTFARPAQVAGQTAVLIHQRGRHPWIRHPFSLSLLAAWAASLIAVYEWSVALLATAHIVLCLIFPQRFSSTPKSCPPKEHLQNPVPIPVAHEVVR